MYSTMRDQTKILFPREKAERMAKNLLPLSMAGVGGELLLAMLEMQLSIEGWPQLSREERKYLGGPVVVHEGVNGWGTKFAGHPIHTYKGQIYAERVEVVLRLAEWPVGPTEVMAVMYAATMDAPITHEAANIYVWAASHAAQKKHFPNKTYTELQPASAYDKPITDDDILHGRYHHAFRDLCREIRSKVERHSMIGAPKRRSQEPVTTDRFDLFSEIEKPA